MTAADGAFPMVGMAAAAGRGAESDFERAGKRRMAQQWQVESASGVCGKTGRALGEGEEFWSPESTRWTSPVEVIDIGVPRELLAELGEIVQG